MLISIITNKCQSNGCNPLNEMKENFDRLSMIYPNANIQLEVKSPEGLRDTEGHLREVLWEPTIDMDGVPYIKGRYLTYDELEEIFEYL